MKVELKNIQSIEHAVYDFPDTGIVQIAGGNSNGKSILFKAIGAVVTLSIMSTSKRNSLLRRGCSDGEIIMQHEDKVLYTYLHRDRNKCYVGFQKGKEQPVTRTFRDSGIDELIKSFGFYCYGKNSVCLQLYETFGPMPFVNTSDEVNGEIVESVTEDQVAKKFLESFKNVTHPKALEQRKMLDKKIESLIQLKETIVMYDWRKYEDFGTKMRKYYNILKFARVAKVEHVMVPPELNICDVEFIKLPHVNVPPETPIYDIEPTFLVKPKVVYEPMECVLEKPTQLVYEMTMMEEGICPTCGRQLIEIE